ncbi:MAG: outer membrane beta-barrel protein [Ferruginibacter sp.]
MDYSRYNNVSDQSLSTGFFDGNYNKTSDSMFLKGHLPAEINIYSLKSDFVHKYKNGINVEAGIKSSYVTSDNMVEYVRLAGNAWIPDARNNHFVYKENINAAYINLHKEFKKWDVQTGLRAENTNTEGVQAIDNSSVTRHYTNLFSYCIRNL